MRNAGSWVRRWWKPLVGMTAALIVVGVWYLRQPRTYRLVAEYPIECFDQGNDMPPRWGVYAAPAGCLVREREDRFVMRDWQGRVRWRVTVRPSLPLWLIPEDATWAARIRRYAPPRRLVYALSPDGRYFAVAVPQPAGMRLRIWRDGRLVGDHEETLDLATYLDKTLPEPVGFMRLLDAPGYQPVSLVVLNSGRVFMAVRGKGDCPVLAIEGNTVAARGVFPPWSQLGPDAQCLVTARRREFGYYSVTVHAGAIQCAHRFLAREAVGVLFPYANSSHYVYGALPEYPGLLPGGLVLGDRDGIYRTAGRVTRRSYNSVYVTPAGGQILCAGWWGGSCTNLVTGMPWMPKRPPLLQGAMLGITPGGRYLLLHEVDKPLWRLPLWRLPRAMVALLNRPRPFRQILERRHDSLALYETPGRLRALLPVVPSSSGSPYVRVPVNVRWHDYDLLWCHPSPDGKTMIAIGRHRERKTFRCLVFRW